MSSKNDWKYSVVQLSCHALRNYFGDLLFRSWSKSWPYGSVPEHHLLLEADADAGHDEEEDASDVGHRVEVSLMKSDLEDQVEHDLDAPEHVGLARTHPPVTVNHNMINQSNIFDMKVSIYLPDCESVGEISNHAKDDNDEGVRDLGCAQVKDVVISSNADASDCSDEGAHGEPEHQDRGGDVLALPRPDGHDGAQDRDEDGGDVPEGPVGVVPLHERILVQGCRVVCDRAVHGLGMDIGREKELGPGDQDHAAQHEGRDHDSIAAELLVEHHRCEEEGGDLNNPLVDIMI